MERPKPDPEIYLKTADLLGVDPLRCVVFEDSHGGVAAARAAGMHVVGIRNELAARHPWLPGAVLKAFTQAKTAALELLADTSATKVTLPFVEEQLKAARETMGEDFWSYGVAANRRTLETFVRHHHAQGLSARLMSVDELFHPSTYETYSI